jgi:TolB-like protein
VVARNTALTFKGKAVDVKALGRELNVRYVLERVASEYFALAERKAPAR